MAELRVGTSGWQYRDWKGRLYPEDLPVSRWFDRYAEIFDTVEINASFYRLPTERAVDGWRARAPDHFRYAVKYSRYGSHLKKLADPEGHLRRFLDRAERLGPTLGPILVQLPPHWGVDLERLDTFLRAAPRRHRWAVEVRDPSWLVEEVYEVLRDHDAALCHHDLLADHPEVRTASFAYRRFHGAAGKYAGEYGREALEEAAGPIRELLADGLDTWVYFNNDRGGAAVRDALTLREVLAVASADAPAARRLRAG